MPKHERINDNKTYKKDKHKHLDETSNKRDVSSKKPKHHSNSPDSSSNHRHEKHKHNFSQVDEKSPPHKKTKVESGQSSKNYERKKNVHQHPIKVNIKQEEDFDRRQEELRKRRREGHRERRNDPVSSRQVKMEHDERIKDAFTKSNDKKQEKEKPNLGLSGALTEDTNTYRGVVIKYNEPPEARIPKKRWRLYPFKGSESLKTLYLHRQSAFLLGRQRRIVDIPIDHPSCSKQHAVLQFRIVEVDVDGELRRRVKPYLIDLGSSNGSYINNERIEPQRYVELKEQDVVKFGFSSREYVLLHDKSDTSHMSSESEEDD